MDPSENSILLKSTMTYGAILGAALVFYSIILFAFNILPIGILIPCSIFVISISIYYTGIYLATRKIRDTLFDGSISYKQGLLIGTLIAFFAAIITAFYGYIQNAIIDPEYPARVINAEKEWMVHFMTGKIPEEQIEKSLAEIDAKMKDSNVGYSALTSIFSSTIFGFLISLITSAFLKKKTDPFSEVPNTNDEQ